MPKASLAYPKFVVAIEGVAHMLSGFIPPRMIRDIFGCEILLLNLNWRFQDTLFPALGFCRLLWNGLWRSCLRKWDLMAAAATTFHPGKALPLVSVHDTEVQSLRVFSYGLLHYVLKEWYGCARRCRLICRVSLYFSGVDLVSCVDNSAGHNRAMSGASRKA